MLHHSLTEIGGFFNREKIVEEVTADSISENFSPEDNSVKGSYSHSANAFA